MINSRSKGAGAEREIITILYEQLGVKLARNLEQSRNGGYDLIPEPGSLLEPYAIEIKRYTKLSNALIKGFWLQTVKQAEAAKKTPVLLFREDRAEWKSVIPLYSINPNLSTSTEIDDCAIVSLSTFCQIVRER